MFIEAEPQIGNGLYDCLHGAFVCDVHRHDDGVTVHEVEPIRAPAVSRVDEPCLADASHQVGLSESACERFLRAYSVQLGELRDEHVVKRVSQSRGEVPV